MGDLRDAVRARLAEVEQAVIELHQTRSQSALEYYQSARELLVDAVEAVRATGHADVEIDESAYPYDLCERCGGEGCNWCEYTGEAEPSVI